jgi:hypothetical protein
VEATEASDCTTLPQKADSPADPAESGGQSRRVHRAGPPKGNVNARKHGLNTLKKAFSQLGSRALDGRSQASVAIRRWRAELIADVGGDDAVSTQQLAIIDLAGKQKLLLDSIDTWLLSQPSLINARKRSVIPVVLQRQALADGLAKYLSQLGLQRRHKVKSLQEILSADHADDTGDGKEDAP